MTQKCDLGLHHKLTGERWNFPPGRSRPDKMPAPQRCPYCLRLLLGQTYHEEERRVREGTRSGRGAPMVPPVSGLMPSGPGRGQGGPPPPQSWVLAVATSLLQVNCLLQFSPPGCFQLQAASAALSFSALSGGPSDPFKGPQAAPALTRNALMTALGGRSSSTLDPVSGLSCRFGLRTELL